MDEVDKLEEKVTHLDNEVFFLVENQRKLMIRIERLEAAYNGLLPRELRKSDVR